MQRQAKCVRPPRRYWRWPDQAINPVRYRCRESCRGAEKPCYACRCRVVIYGSRGSTRPWIVKWVPGIERLARWRQGALHRNARWLKGPRDAALLAVERELLLKAPVLRLLAESGINGHIRTVDAALRSGRAARQMVETVEKWEWWLAGGAPGKEQVGVEPAEGVLEATLWRLWWHSYGNQPETGKPVLFWLLGRKIIREVLPVLAGYRLLISRRMAESWALTRKRRLQRLEREIEAEEGQ